MSEALPESPLSSLSSSDEMADDHISTPNRSARPSIDTESLPPSKRRRTGGAPLISTTIGTPSSVAAEHETDTDLDISCDSEGSAPGSPSHDEFAMRADQVSLCQWDGCGVGDLGNSDDLIAHVQQDHIAPKRARYTCEWGDCARKGTNHPSGYALKAHMRSHTKEKPFFCHLPECDRSFTRSDALAKHMRTVHEPEPPRAAQTNANPIDPATGQPKKGPKLRLSMNGAAAKANARPPSIAPAPAPAPVPIKDAPIIDSTGTEDPSPPMDNITYRPAFHPITGQPGFMITYPPDINFSQFESEVPANQLMRLLRRQLNWAQKEADELKTDIHQLETLHRREWAAKEVLLEGVLEAELRAAEHDGGVDSAEANDMREGALDRPDREWSKDPWWRRPDQPDDSEDMDVDMELDEPEKRVNAQQEQDERDDDMMAVGALMGLSAG